MGVFAPNTQNAETQCLDARVTLTLINALVVSGRGPEMDHYVKGETRDVDDGASQHVSLDARVVHMSVKDGTKIRNVMGFALKKIGVSGQHPKIRNSKNGNSVFSVENSSMSDKFWQKVSHL